MRAFGLISTGLVATSLMLASCVFSSGDNGNRSKTPVGESCVGGSTLECQAEAAMLPMVNDLRAQRGLPALELDQRLSFVARDWARQRPMSRWNPHAGFPSERQALLASKFGQTNLYLSAENVASETASGGSANAIASDFFEMWRTSSGHLSNMLGEHSKIGIGIAIDGGEMSAVQVFAVRE
jgi:uncharacterized protein YkwD